MRKAISVFIFIISAMNLYGQSKYNSLRTKLLKSDSIVIVSHQGGDNYVDEQGKDVSERLIVKEKLNLKSIHERRKLEVNEIKRLLSILTLTNYDNKIEMATCFMPHHAILIFKGSKLSYINICFDCRKIDTSDDLNLSVFDFSKRKWNELIKFYKAFGFKYQLF